MEFRSGFGAINFGPLFEGGNYNPFAERTPQLQTPHYMEGRSVMNKKIVYAILAAAVAVALVVLLVKVVSGAFSLLSGAVNAVLGIVVVLVLVAIVIWMFRYASKK